MPAPTEGEISAAITAALLPDFPSAKMVNGERVVDPTQLQPDMQKIVDGVSRGVALVWTTWQAKQVVTVPGITPGTGATIGTLTP